MFFFINFTKYFDIILHEVNRSICLKNLSEKIFWFSFLANCIKLLAARLIKRRSYFNNLYPLFYSPPSKNEINILDRSDQAGSKPYPIVSVKSASSSLNGAACCVQSAGRVGGVSTSVYPYRRAMSASMPCHVIAFRGRPHWVGNKRWQRAAPIFLRR